MAMSEFAQIIIFNNLDDGVLFFSLRAGQSVFNTPRNEAYSVNICASNPGDTLY